MAFNFIHGRLGALPRAKEIYCFWSESSRATFIHPTYGALNVPARWSSIFTSSWLSGRVYMETEDSFNILFSLKLFFVVSLQWRRAEIFSKKTTSLVWFSDRKILCEEVFFSLCDEQKFSNFKSFSSSRMIDWYLISEPFLGFGAVFWKGGNNI